MMMFLLLLLVGLLFLVVGSLFGHDHDVAGSVDHSIDQDGVVSIFSTKVLAAFVMGFGAAGFIGVVQFHLSNMMASLWGIGGGVVIGGFMYVFLYFLSRQQGSSSYSLNSLIGVQGTLSVGIEENRRGEVCVTAKNCPTAHLAVSKDGSTIDKGAFVKVVGISGSELVVEKI